MHSTNLRRRDGLWGSVAACALAAALAAAALPALAGAAVYPSGGSAFDAGLDGWQATGGTCNVTALSLCEASGEHDAASGSPAGSLTARTSVTLNLAALFESTVVLESPDFAVAEAGPATLHLERQFSPGGLLALSPQATYGVSLIDRGTGVATEVLTEALEEGDAEFAGKDGATAVASGRTYAISIEVETTALAALGLLETESDVRFDNVALTTTEALDDDDDGGGGSGGSGSGGSGGSAGAGAGSGSDGGAATLTARELRTAVRRGDAPGARLRGKHVFVRVRCPKRAGRACRIVAQGRIKRRVRVTQRRAVRVASGRTRLVALRVKPRFREKVAKRKRLLVVQRVRAGEVRTTFARSRALIRRR